MFKAKNRILANMFDQWQLSRLLVEDKFKHRIRIFVKYLFLGVWTWLESSGSLKSLKSPKNVHILINKKFSFFIFEWFCIPHASDMYSFAPFITVHKCCIQLPKTWFVPGSSDVKRIFATSLACIAYSIEPTKNRSEDDWIWTVDIVQLYAMIPPNAKMAFLSSIHVIRLNRRFCLNDFDHNLALKLRLKPQLVTQCGNITRRQSLLDVFGIQCMAWH